MKRIWIYSNNPFFNATKDSFKKFLKLSSKHIDSLKAKQSVAFFDNLVALYEPLHIAYSDAFTAWKSAGEVQQGSTQNLTQLLKQLQGIMIEDWDIRIQNIYKKSTDTYKALLPNGRKPFQTGSQESKIGAVSTLIQNIGTNAQLATLKAEIVTVSGLLEAAESNKNQKLTTTKTDSSGVEAAHLDACTGMYFNLGSLMSHFAKTPENIEDYFDMSLLRHGEQTEFEVSIKKGAIKNIVKRTLELTDMITVLNDGNANLIIYCAATKDGGPDVAFANVDAGQSLTILASELGNNLTHPFINLRNESSTLPGHCEVNL